MSDSKSVAVTKDAINAALDSLEQAADWLASVDESHLELVGRLQLMSARLEELKAEIWEALGS